MAGAYCGHRYQTGGVERRDDQMLPRRRRGPVAGQPDDEDHRAKRGIGEPETMPDPERNDGAGSWNQVSRSARRRRREETPEKGNLHPHAEKADRASGEGFLDPVAIEPGL